mmetsp:Transcript_13726/g.26920  ORF Transcript_13726/g.26920 Transcript_13726/m.26920 type:complete len:322 (+) Transcript_13726:320-1285(+)
MPAPRILSMACPKGKFVLTTSCFRNMAVPDLFFRKSTTGSMRSFMLSLVKPRMSDAERVATSSPFASSTGSAATMKSLPFVHPVHKCRKPSRAVSVDLMVIGAFFPVMLNFPIGWAKHFASAELFFISFWMKRMTSVWLTMRMRTGCFSSRLYTITLCGPWERRKAMSLRSPSSQKSQSVRDSSVTPKSLPTGVSKTPLFFSTAFMSSAVSSFFSTPSPCFRIKGARTTAITRSEAEMMPSTSPFASSTGRAWTLCFASSESASSTVDVFLMQCNGFASPIIFRRSAVLKPSKNVRSMSSSVFVFSFSASKAFAREALYSS